MAIKVAINGFGRIGRAAFKIAMERKQDLEIVAINDLAEIENLVYLLKYDSVYGRYARAVKLESGHLVVDGQTIQVFAEKEPLKLPWKDLGVDVVIESTGIFLEEDTVDDHIEASFSAANITAVAISISPTLHAATANSSDPARRSQSRGFTSIPL